ncbi:MAG: hypothetical protein IPN20_15060 [Haliscomenobacter sp.]|nr:hypothetical protein [Haliscomenobacter sp.]
MDKYPFRHCCPHPRFQNLFGLCQSLPAYGAIEGNVLANQKVLWELAGRNIAMIVATVLALRSQNAMFLAFTMMINLVREGFDMFMGIRFSGGDMGQIMQAGSFLVFLIPYFIALGNLRKLAALPE